MRMSQEGRDNLCRYGGKREAREPTLLLGLLDQGDIDELASRPPFTMPKVGDKRCYIFYTFEWSVADGTQVVSDLRRAGHREMRLRFPTHGQVADQACREYTLTDDVITGIAPCS